MNDEKRDEGFAGFPDGRLLYTPLPNLFFSGLLPQIDNLAELKVTLHVFWLLYQKKGWPRCISLRQLLSDHTLMRGLRPLASASRGEAGGDGAPAGLEAALQDGLQLAVQRGTLLHLVVEFADRNEHLYFLNTASSKDVILRLRRGEIDLNQIAVSPTGGSLAPVPVEVRVERPNIFALYEQNIGLLTPLLVEELRDAERLYPAAWIEEAFKVAVGYNKRSWKYIQRILERWRSEGRQSGSFKNGGLASVTPATNAHIGSAVQMNSVLSAYTPDSRTGGEEESNDRTYEWE